jgi:chromosome segregation ATPase
MKKVSKAFFSEQKKQKTFILLPWPRKVGVPRKQKFFGSFFQKRTCFLFCVLLFAPQAQAQKPPPRHTQVGAGDIFAALTQPDHPAELDALHALRDALSGSPDPAKLEAARARLAEVLQAEERHQADMPPALVMSGIAGRIEAAMAALEEARHVPPPPPDRLQTLAVPVLGAVSAGLAVALIACLAGLASRGRSSEAQEELQDTLKKIRRRLEAAPTATPGGGLAQDLAEMASGEASEAVHQATVAVDRLGSATRDAEGRLQTSVGEAEARLHAAAAMAGQLEQWMEALPDRLSASVQGIEAHTMPALDAAAARMEESAASLAGLQDLLADYGGAVSGLTAQAEQATDNLHAQLSVLQKRFETLAGALPERVTNALPPAMAELNSAADLLAELSTLSIGQTVRLEDIVARVDKLAADLPAVAHALESASKSLLARIDQDAGTSAAANQAAEDVAEMARLARAAAESLGERLATAADAMEVRLAGSADRIEARLEAAAGAVSETLAGKLGTAAEAAGSLLIGRTELAQAGLESAALMVADAAATLPSIRDGLRDVTAELRSEAGVQTAALREAAASLAAEGAALPKTARAHVAGDGASEGHPAPEPGRVEALAQNLVMLTSRLETVLRAAEALHAEAAEQVESARAEEADQVATLFEVLAGRAEACLSALPGEAAALAATAAQLRGDAAELAATAMRMDADAPVADRMPAQAGAILNALQSVCQRLEDSLAALGGTGMALDEGVARIGREVRRLQDGSDSAQAGLAASAAAVQEAASMLKQGLAGVRATDAAQASDPAVQEVQAQLTVLTARLGAVLEDLGHRAAEPTQSTDTGRLERPLLDTLTAQADELAALLGQFDTLRAQAERMAAMLDRNEQVAERLAEAASAVADAATAVVERPVQAPDTLAATQPALIGLQAATETVQRAAMRLLESAQAQDAALARAGQAAADVARLVTPPKADTAEGHALAGLHGLASLAESLQGEAESLAACVLRGDSVRIPSELITQTPVMLAAIETSIHRLRGTATALALASDGRLKAA